MSKAIKGVAKAVTRATSVGKTSLLPVIAAATGNPWLAAGASAVNTLGNGGDFTSALLSGGLSGLSSGIASGISSGQGAGSAFGNNIVGRALNSAQNGFADTDLGRFLGAGAAPAFNTPSLGTLTGSMDVTSALKPSADIVTPGTSQGWLGRNLDSIFGSSAPAAATQDQDFANVISSLSNGGAPATVGEQTSPGWLDSIEKQLGGVYDKAKGNPLNTAALLLKAYQTINPQQPAGTINAKDMLAEKQAAQAKQDAYNAAFIKAMNAAPGTFTQTPQDAEYYQHYGEKTGNGGPQIVFNSSGPAPVPQLAKGGMMNSIDPKVPKSGMLPQVTQGQSGRFYQGQGGGQDDTLDVGNARLSANEYVHQADVVSALGDGNPDVGAAKLDKMGENIRKAKAKGKKSAKSGDPMKYLPKNYDGRRLRSVSI